MDTDAVGGDCLLAVEIGSIPVGVVNINLESHDSNILSEWRSNVLVEAPAKKIATRDMG